ncbi:hypothetical protein ECDEC12B_5793 [Escherichia coli DEC12B]|nr:hypothetical protein ECDEC12B_5793 [Escherichia coli DEC12B]
MTKSKHSQQAAYLLTLSLRLRNRKNKNKTTKKTFPPVIP